MMRGVSLSGAGPSSSTGSQHASYIFHPFQYVGCLVIAIVLLLYAMHTFPVLHLPPGTVIIVSACFLALWAALLYGVCVDARCRIIPNITCAIIALSGLCAAFSLHAALPEHVAQTPISFFVPCGQGNFASYTQGSPAPYDHEVFSLVVGSLGTPLLIQVVSVSIILGVSECLWRRIFATPGVGLGDIKLLMALSCWIGWGTFIVYAGALLCACCMAFFKTLVRRQLLRTFAFGPAISLSFLSLFFLASMTVYT